MNTERKTPRGFSCQWCGKQHHFSGYVYAHMRETLTHTCDYCGAEHEVVMCTVGMKVAGREDRKDGNRTVEGS